MNSGHSLQFQGKNALFKLPREHGVVVVFSFACLIALSLCGCHQVSVALGLLLLWAMFLSLHRPLQLLLISFFGAVAFHIGAGLPQALWIVVVWAGIQVVTGVQRSSDLWWREALGLSGIALSPLVLSYLQAGQLSLHLLAVITLFAAIFTGAALIRVSRKETALSAIPSAVLSLAFWLYLAHLNSWLAACNLFPYVLQALWLMTTVRPSFKRLGVVQSLCLLWVVLGLFIQVARVLYF